MVDFASLRKIIASQPLARRNRNHPFEFGDVQARDRLMAQATLRHATAGQGTLLTKQTVFDTGFTVEGGIPPGIRTAQAAFRTVQRLFESHAVESRLKPWKLLGFMSDSMIPNGLASRLHHDDDKVHFINVTAGSYFHTLFAAFHFVSDPRVEPHLPGRGEFMVASATTLFTHALRVPASVERRSFASRIATRALLATFLHELAHVFRGHTLFIERDAAPTGIVEVHNAVTSSIDPLRRALELDADMFCGQFLARVVFQGVGPEARSLHNPAFRKVAFEVLLGVTLMFSWFDECEGYHGGVLRALVVLDAMFAELKIGAKESGAWTGERISALQVMMGELSLLPAHATQVRQGDLDALLEQTMLIREARQHDWVKLRPWPSAQGDGDR